MARRESFFRVLLIPMDKFRDPYIKRSRGSVAKLFFAVVNVGKGGGDVALLHG